MIWIADGMLCYVAAALGFRLVIWVLRGVRGLGFPFVVDRDLEGLSEECQFWEFMSCVGQRPCYHPGVDECQTEIWMNALSFRSPSHVV